MAPSGWASNFYPTDVDENCLNLSSLPFHQPANLNARHETRNRTPIASDDLPHCVPATWCMKHPNRGRVCSLILPAPQTVCLSAITSHSHSSLITRGDTTFDSLTALGRCQLARHVSGKLMMRCPPSPRASTCSCRNLLPPLAHLLVAHRPEIVCAAQTTGITGAPESHLATSTAIPLRMRCEPPSDDDSRATRRRSYLLLAPGCRFHHLFISPRPRRPCHWTRGHAT